MVYDRELYKYSNGNHSIRLSLVEISSYSLEIEVYGVV